MKEIYVENELQLKNAFSSNNPVRAKDNDLIIIKKNIILNSDLIIDVLVTFSFEGGMIFTQDYAITARQNP